MQEIRRLKDLAKELGVSITTVSKALNNHPDISAKRKKEILDYAKKVNYHPNQVAKNFRQQKTTLIGIVVSNSANPYYARVIRGIEEVFTKAGYYTIIMNTHEDAKHEQFLINQLIGLNVAGVLLTPASGNTESRALLKKCGIPYVLVDRYLEEENDMYVVLDDFKAAYIATKYLCGYQNEKIFLLNYLPEVSSAKNRLAGYKKALKEEEVYFDESCIINGCTDQEEGYEAMKTILDTEKVPFSVLCYSDYVAIGAMCAIQERGYRTPYDVALIGTDDIESISFMKPRLTTVAVPKLRLGKRSAELLIEMLKDKNHKCNSNNDSCENPKEKEEHIVMKPELIIRETA